MGAWRRSPFDDRGSYGLSGAVGLRAGGLPARVAVIFGGPSPEHDVSVLTGLQALRGLSGAPGVGEVRSLYWSKTGEWFEVPIWLEAEAFVDWPPKGAAALRLVTGPSGGFLARGGGLFSKESPIEIDVLLICCHGGPGEDGTLQAVLDLTGIPYSGPTAIGAALGMDKVAFASLMSHAGLPALPRQRLTEKSPPPKFPPPYILKPRYGGSSIGVEVVTDFETAKARLGANRHLRNGAVVEPFRAEMFDLQIAARLWPEAQLSAIERPLRTQTSGEILGYQDKYVGSEGMASAPRELPAKIPVGTEKKLRSLALEAAAVAGLRGVARLDFLSDGTDVFVNEVNTIPGSLARYLWVEPQLPFGALLLDLLTEAIACPSHSYSTAGADGSVLRAAGSIASKLG
jgi:D-alanine-D-alanine ligase